MAPVGGKLRGAVQSTVRQTYGDSAVTAKFKSKVVHPRNPKLVKSVPEDDKVSPGVLISQGRHSNSVSFEGLYILIELVHFLLASNRLPCSDLSLSFS